MKRMLLLLIFVTMISACSSEKQISSNNKSELATFFDGYPSGEMQQELYDLMEQYNIGHFRLDPTKPSHIKEFPTFIIRGSKGEFETNNFDELKEYLKQNY